MVRGFRPACWDAPKKGLMKSLDFLSKIPIIILIGYPDISEREGRRGNGKMRKEVDKFEVLEEKITQLVEAYASLSNEKNALGKKLAQKEMEIQGLMEKVAQLSQERETARERVEGLLNRLDRLISSRDMVSTG